MKSILVSFVLMACFCLLGESVNNDDDWAASTLRAGDVLDIEVFRVTEFTRSALIEEDGTFLFPYCGSIKAAGLTPREIAREIEKKLASQIAEPQVFVNVSTWAPRRIYILGEVKEAKSIELNTYSRMTALQAISVCGGFAESADLNNVVVIRRNPKTTQYQRLPVDVTALLASSTGSDNFRLRPDDTILVPKAPPVIVSGDINNASIIYIDTQRPPLLSEFVMRAGGFKSTANVGNICVVRTDADGKRVYIQASLLSEQPGIYEKDILVKPGDYILVGSNEEIYVLGKVTRPGPVSFAPNQKITAMKAITLAGGFAASAKKNDILLIRGDTREILNLRNLYDDENYKLRDKELLDGDILFVPESLF